MNMVWQSAFLKALGWSLLDSLWQMGVLWLLYVTFTANGKRFASKQRHALALLSLAGGSLWFVITLVINIYDAAAAPTVITLQALENAMPASISYSLLGRVSTGVEPALPFLSAAYLLVAAWLFIRFFRQYRHTQQLLTAEVKKVSPELRVFLQRMAAQMGIKKKVQIWLSSVIDAPLTLGFWKPVILLPLAAINHLSIQQTEAIILHELYHIKRNDYLINLLVAGADVIFFFNPFARFFTNIIRKERENSCDDMVLQFRYDGGLYAQSLLILEKSRHTGALGLAVAATGDHENRNLLLNRVKRILQQEPVRTPVSYKLVAFLFSALLIGFIGWYNPGKVIVKTIRMVSTPTTPTAEFASTTYTTQPALEKQTQKVWKVRMEVKKTTVAQTASKKKGSCNKNVADLEKLLSSLTQAQLAALVDESLQAAQASIRYVTNREVREFSLPPTSGSTPAASVPVDNSPYVPSSSFSYMVIEDTALPKRYVMTPAEQKAKESMDNAMKALHEIDWIKLEKELKASGKKNVDIIQLQQLMKNAFEELNWEKIGNEAKTTEATLRDEQLRKQEAWRMAFEKFMKDRLAGQEKTKELQLMILDERLQENRKVQKCSCGKKEAMVPATQTSGKKVKKIVEI